MRRVYRIEGGRNRRGRGQAAQRLEADPVGGTNVGAAPERGPATAEAGRVPWTKGLLPGGLLCCL